jgi:hypothetical protein
MKVHCNCSPTMFFLFSEHHWKNKKGGLGSSDGLYTLHDVWERPPANNLPQTPHNAGAYDTGYVLFYWKK